MTVLEQTIEQLRAMELTRGELVTLFRKQAGRQSAAAAVVAQAAVTLLSLRDGAQ